MHSFPVTLNLNLFLIYDYIKHKIRRREEDNEVLKWVGLLYKLSKICELFSECQ